MAQTGLLKDVAGGGVNFPAGDPRPGGVNARFLGIQDRIVHIFHLPGGLAQRHGAGHVRTVAPHLAAEIHGDKHAGIHHLVARDGVRPGAVGPCGHNRVKGDLVPAPAH